MTLRVKLVSQLAINYTLLNSTLFKVKDEGIVVTINANLNYKFEDDQ